MIDCDVLCNVWASDEEWNVDIFLDSAGLAGWESMLANVVPIVTCINDVGVVQQLQLFDLTGYVSDQVIDRSECLKSETVELIIVIDNCLIPEREILEVGRSIVLGGPR